MQLCFICKKREGKHSLDRIRRGIVSSKLPGVKKDSILCDRCYGLINILYNKYLLKRNQKGIHQISRTIISSQETSKNLNENSLKCTYCGRYDPPFQQIDKTTLKIIRNKYSKITANGLYCKKCLQNFSGLRDLIENDGQSASEDPSSSITSSDSIDRLVYKTPMLQQNKVTSKYINFGTPANPKAGPSNVNEDAREGLSTETIDLSISSEEILIQRNRTMESCRLSSDVDDEDRIPFNPEVPGSGTELDHVGPRIRRSRRDPDLIPIYRHVNGG